MANNQVNGATMLQSKTENIVSFNSLANKFLGAYKEFSVMLNKSGILDRLLTQKLSYDPSRFNCLITCGISGAGKSTLIARLISGLSAEEFWLTIQEAPRDEYGRLHIMEDDYDIVLGGGNIATTLIPSVYLVGNTFICDMPGFTDASPEKDAIISILRKCLLTKIKTGRLLIVCKAADLLEDRMGSGTLISNYVQPLKDLVGIDSFAACLKYSHFVVTRSELDRANTSVAKISPRLRNAVFDLHASNPQGAQFLTRLETCKIFTDYEHEDGAELLRKLNELISNDIRANSVDDALVDWKIEALAAGGDELNIRCQIELERIARMIDAEKTAFAKLGDETSVEQKLISEAAALDVQKRATLVAELDALKKKKEDLVKRSGLLPGQIAMNKATVAKLQSVIAVKKEQENLVAEGLADHRVVTVRVDYSSPDSRATPFGPKTHSVDLCMHVGDGDGDMAILVISAQGGADALAQRLGSPEWIPQSISMVNELKADYVLYNAFPATGIKRIDFKMAKDDFNPRMRRIQAKASEPFMVLVYRACRYLNTPEFRALEQQLKNVTMMHEMEIGELEEKIEKDRIELEQVESALGKTTDALLRVQTEKNDMEMVLQHHLARLDAAMDQMLEKFNGLAKKPEIVEMQTNLHLLEEIGKVFIENKIAYPWNPQREQAVKNLEVLLDSIPKHCNNVREWASGRRSVLRQCVNERPSPGKNLNQGGEKRTLQVFDTDSVSTSSHRWDSESPVSKKSG